MKISPAARAGLILALAVLRVGAAEFGGHEAPAAAPVAAPADERRATLEEMWRRRLLPPDQDGWSPADLELLGRIRRAEKDALAYLRRRPGGVRSWTAKPRPGADARPILTKEGYERYFFLLTQEAIDYFDSKGADAKVVFKLKDADGKPMFDGAGRITDEGARAYGRARLNMEVYWSAPDGQIFGTRRPPTKNP